MKREEKIELNNNKSSDEETINYNIMKDNYEGLYLKIKY